MPKVSIIIPTYNSSLFIKRAIDSAINKTFKDWELLIVDDCSKDNTMELVSEFIKQDPRIKLLKTPENSGGPAMPKNIGIENAQGEYVAFLDHDDEWLPEKLEKQLVVFENSEDEKLGIVSCFINIIDNNGRLISKHHENYKEKVLEHIVKRNFIFTSSCVLTRLEIIKNVGLFDTNLKIADDFDMWLRMAKMGYNFNYISEYLINYIAHGGNACYGNNKKDTQEFIKIYEKHMDVFLKYNLRKVGSYHLYKNEKKLARKYYFLSIFNKKVQIDEIIKSFAYIILSFLPDLEPLFRKIFADIKNVRNFLKNKRYKHENSSN